jgi:hypothetical protein
MAIQHYERKSRRKLTQNRPDPKLSLPGRSQAIFGDGPERYPVSGNSGSGIDEDGIHSRNVSVLLLQCAAGVCRGLDSKSSSESRRPTRQSAWWVFCFLGSAWMGTDGEVANARVCKTCIRGFDSHSVLQSFLNQSFLTMSGGKFRCSRNAPACDQEIA